MVRLYRRPWLCLALGGATWYCSLNWHMGRPRVYAGRINA